jgi:hypothetical protein
MFPLIRLPYDPDRWTWFAAGDETLVPKRARSEPQNNSPDRLAWEIGLVLAAPLAFAAIVTVWLGG